MNNKLLFSISNSRKINNNKIVLFNKNIKNNNKIFINQSKYNSISSNSINIKYNKTNRYFFLKMRDNAKSINLVNNEKSMKIIENIALRESKLSKLDLSKVDNNMIIGITIINSIPYFSHEVSNSKNNINVHHRGRSVLNFIKKVCSISPKKINCKLAIGLHDAHDDMKEGLMVFSKKKDSKCILIPDLYSMNNYGGKINNKDNIPFLKKKNESLFIGSTTGNNNPENNSRLKLCDFSLNNKKIKAYINNICQISEEKIAITYPKYKNFLHKNLSINDQVQYKYLINVDGNTCAWDRLVWILNTNSICLKQKSDNKCWYYDLMENNKHYIEFNEPNDINTIINKLSPEKCNDIIKNANAFVNEYLRENSHMLYMSNLLYNLSEKK